MAVPPPDTGWVESYGFYIFTAVGGTLAAFVHWLGKMHRPSPTPSSVLTVDGALMDNRAVDPLRRDLQELTAAVNKLIAIQVDEAERERVRREVQEDERMKRILEELEEKKRRDREH